MFYRGTSRGRGGGRGGGRGVGSWGARHSQRTPELAASPSPPLGALIEAIARDDVSDNVSVTQERCGITRTKLFASYNWLDQPAPMIVVPGKPPLWTPPRGPQKLREDSGVFYRDRNSASYPSHPLEPAVVSVMKMNPDPVAVDVFACGSTLGNLLRFVRGEEKSFRMLVEVVGRTVHLIRRENSPKEQILGVRGYGHTFPEAYTTWESDVRCSKSHQRILKYRFGGLNLLVRFEGDGYIKPEVDASPGTRRTASIGEGDGLGQLENLRLQSPASGRADSSKGLQVTDGGQVAPQDAIFDLKTRSIKAKERDTLGEELPRLWVTQTHKFILAHHEWGVFKDVQVQDVRDVVQAWETDNQPSLRRMSSLLHHVVDKALEEDGVKLEIVRREGGPLEIRKRLPDAGTALSAEVRRQWSAWLEGPLERGGGVSLLVDSGGPSGGDDTNGSESEDDDFTACGEECEYCGKCR